ncbi:hypothetical protein AAVH_18282 [Aphelenchoides avenae]|nr:hypothetical protein AAVH_18282 [Aphelenchus avenae]
MPLYYDWHFTGALVSVPVWIWISYLAYYDISRPWLCLLLHVTLGLISGCCWRDLLPSFYHEWLEPPDLQLDNAAPAIGNAAQLQRGRFQHVSGLPGMLTDVFQCLPRAGLDACQLVSRLFRDAVEDARTTLPLYMMRVDLRPSTPLVEYTAWIRNVGSVAGHFFTGLRRVDSPYFRNAVIELRADSATYARTSTDMISAFVRWLSLDERNIRFTSVECDVYDGELEGIFRFTDRHDIREMHVFYKRSLNTPGCDFLARVFAEARKRSLGALTVGLTSVKAVNCDMELQMGFQVLSEIFQDQKRPSAERLSVIVPRLKGFRLLQRIDQAYARGEITRPLIIGCDASVPLAELWPENGFLIDELPAVRRGPATMRLFHTVVNNYYIFSLPC